MKSAHSSNIRSRVNCVWLVLVSFLSAGLTTVTYAQELEEIIVTGISDGVRLVDEEQFHWPVTS